MFKRIAVIASTFLALTAGSAGAAFAQAAAAPAPAAEAVKFDLAKFKKEVVDRYESVYYYDTAEKPLSAEDFMKALEEGKLNFRVQASGNAERPAQTLILTLLVPRSGK